MTTILIGMLVVVVFVLQYNHAHAIHQSCMPVSLTLVKIMTFHRKSKIEITRHRFVITFKKENDGNRGELNFNKILRIDISLRRTLPQCSRFSSHEWYTH